MKEWEARKWIIEMTEEQFSTFCQTCGSEQVKIMTEMRFFHRLFNDPQHYRAVEQSVGNAVYQTLRN